VVQRILLTGAGFSRNWGGYLAREVWELLLGHPAVRADPRLRASLLEAPENFERALAIVRGSYPEGAAMFENALLDVFVDQDESERADYFTINEGRFRGFLDAFRSPDGTAQLFTLNQDLFLERRCCDLTDLVLPGASKAVFRDWQEALSTRQGIPISSAPNAALQKGRLNYVKLHGSFNWRSESGDSLLVAGDDKGKQITARFPLLAQYLDLFRAACNAGDTWLVVAGYSFGDEHINEAISVGVQHGLRLVIIDPASPEALRTSPGLRNHGEIWNALVGYCSTSLLSIFAHLPTADRILNYCLGPS
jgi:SIR2-like protein